MNQSLPPITIENVVLPRSLLENLDNINLKNIKYHVHNLEFVMPLLSNHYYILTDSCPPDSNQLIFFNCTVLKGANHACIY